MVKYDPPAQQVVDPPYLGGTPVTATQLIPPSGGGSKAISALLDTGGGDSPNAPNYSDFAKQQLLGNDALALSSFKHLSFSEPYGYVDPSQAVFGGGKAPGVPLTDKTDFSALDGAVGDGQQWLTYYASHAREINNILKATSWYQGDADPNLGLRAGGEYYKKWNEVLTYAAITGKTIVDILGGGPGESSGAQNLGGTSTLTSSSVDLTDPVTAGVLLDKTLRQATGRAATAADRQAFVSALRASEQANPSISTSTSVRDGVGNTSTTTSSQGGAVNPTALADQFAHSGALGVESNTAAVGSSFYKVLTDMLGGTQ